MFAIDVAIISRDIYRITQIKITKRLPSSSSVEPVHKPHHASSKLVKNFNINYLSTDRIRTGRLLEEIKQFVSIPVRITQSCNLMLSAFEGDVKQVRTLIYFWKRIATNRWSVAFKMI